MSSAPAGTAPHAKRGPGVVAWIRHNLFRNRQDSLVTVVAGVIAAYVVFRTVRYVFVSGQWDVVRANLGLYLYGRYPRNELWRVVTVVVGIAGLGGLIAGVLARRRRAAADDAGEVDESRTTAEHVGDVVWRLWPLLGLVLLAVVLAETFTPTLVALVTVAAAVTGRVVGGLLPVAAGQAVFFVPFLVPFVALPFLTGPLGWEDWGGLMITLLIASVSMLACFPLGVVLALGRRSSLPAARTISVGVIEFFRGVPLVVLVLMSDVALGFFFPQSLLPGKVVRVIIAFTIFTAAYVAEIVRGGLQSVPRGQTEAAQALGMSPLRIMGRIVMPQALRNVIPALVGQFISLFKDTTLVFVIGFLDVLSVADAVTKQRDFDLAQAPEALAFAALLFWVGSYTLSRESQRLETKLGVGTR